MLSLKKSNSFFWSGESKNTVILIFLMIGFLNILPLMNYLMFPIFVFLYDYRMRVIRASIEGKSLPNVTLDRLADQFADGIKYLVIGFVYSIPLLILMIIFFFPLTVAFMLIDFTFEVFVLFFCIHALIFFSIETFWNSMIILPAIYKYQKDMNLNNTFRYREVFEIIKKGWKETIKDAFFTLGVNLVLFALMLISSFFIFICIGIIPYMIAFMFFLLYNMIVMAHYEGQIFKLWKEKGY